MPVLEIIAASATIGSFLSGAAGHGQTKDGSYKIRQPLCSAKTNLSETMKLLSEFQEGLTSEEHKHYLDRLELLESEAGEGLTQSIEEVNAFKRWLKRRRMKRTARRIENDTLTLKSQVQLSSLNAQHRAAQDPAYMERKAKEAQVEDMELEIRYKTAKQKLEEFDRKPDEGFMNQSPLLESIGIII